MMPRALTIAHFGLAILLLFTMACQEEVAIEAVVHDPVSGRDDSDIGFVEISVAAQRNFGIETEAAEFRLISSVMRVTGVVNPDRSRVVHISPLTRGRIEKVYVNMGDQVKQGDPLLEYDNIELGEVVGEFMSVLASLEKCKTQLAISEKHLERAKDLLEVEAIARKEYELRDAQYKGFAADVKMANAQLSQIHVKLHRFGFSDEEIEGLRHDKSENHHREASHTVIKSPFQGVVVQRHAAEGETIEPGNQLLVVVDTSRVWITMDIYEKDLSRIQVGQRVKVQVAAYPNQEFTGKVNGISDVLDPKTRTVKSVCIVNNRDKKLKLQMFANVSIETEKDKRVLTVPSAAVQTDRRDYFVYVRRDDTHFENRMVQVGSESEGYTEIRKGLSDGEQVVTGGAFYTKSEAVREFLGEEHD